MAVDAAVTRGRAGTKYSGKKPDRGSEDCRRSQINSTFAFNPCPRHYLKVRNVLIMQVLVVLVVFLLSLDCLGFSWPRQTKETMVDDSETSIPEGLSSLGGLDRSSLCVTLIHVKTVCSIAENSVLCVSVLVRHMSFLTVLISATPYYIIRSVGVIFA